MSPLDPNKPSHLPSYVYHMVLRCLLGTMVVSHQGHSQDPPKGGVKVDQATSSAYPIGDKFKGVDHEGIGSQAWLMGGHRLSLNEGQDSENGPEPIQSFDSNKSQDFIKKEIPPPGPIIYPFRWENSFNLLLTSLFGKQVFDIGSPSFLAEGVWTYKFQTGTSIGLMLMGSLQSMAVSRDDAKLRFTTYGVGPYLGQDIFRTDDFRLVASLSAGKGYLYVRRKPTITEAKEAFYKTEYVFYEPTLAFIFFQTRHYDIGPIVSYRKTSFNDPMLARVGDHGENIPSSEITVAKENDIDGFSFGFSAKGILF